MLYHDRAARPGHRLRLATGTLVGLGLALGAGMAAAVGQPVAAIVPPPRTSAAAPVSGITGQTGVQTGAQTSAGALRTTLGKEKASRIESHIASLHTALKITPAEEPLWQMFAATMRQTVVRMDQVYAKRQSGYGAMNAVQDLQSYVAVEVANADTARSLLAPFEALYNSFTPEQKKTADTTFLRYTDRAVRKSN